MTLDKQYKLHKVFMNIAYEFASLSNCVSRRVGAVAVQDGRIVSTGYNGSLVGMVNCNELFPNYNKLIDRNLHHFWSNDHEIHAEMNVILYASKHGISLDGCTLYTTTHPCNQCLKNILQIGIKTILYDESYELYTVSDTMKSYIIDNHITIGQLINNGDLNE